MVVVSVPTPGDVPRLRTFLQRAWAESGEGALGWTGATVQTMQEIASEGFLTELLARKGTTVLAAWQEADVVGFAVLRNLEAGGREISGIIVLESQTGQGVGGALLEEARRCSLAAHADGIVVKTEASNERAISFYRRHGFIVEGRVREDVQGTPVELVVLRLRLSERD